MLIQNARIFDGDAFLRADRVQFKDGKVAALGSACVPDEDVFDAGGKIVSPGYVDLHMHGLLGHDVLDGDPANVKIIAEELLKRGTTSFLPSIPTGTTAQMHVALSAIRSAMRLPTGARVLGAHLEGQILSPAARGAHTAELLKPPTIENYAALTEGLDDAVRRVTLAPELDGGMELVSHLKALGVLISAGHTTADGDAFTGAVDRGLTLCTHFFNGMARFSHREMNIVSRALVDDRVYIEFIPDLRHISRDAVEIIWRCKGRRAFFCTDSSATAGLPDGDYALPSGNYHLLGGASIRPDNGSLSGSTIDMQEGVRRLASGTSLPLADILRMATGTPAEVLGETDIGFLRVGKRADALVLNDDLSVQAVIQAGSIAKG